MVGTHYFQIWGQHRIRGIPGDSVVKNSPASAGDTEDTASVPGLERVPGEGNGNPL